MATEKQRSDALTLVLNRWRERLAREKQEKEDRRKWYENTARILLTKAKVEFVETIRLADGSDPRGTIRLTDEGFLITLRENLPLDVERFVFAHELAHGLLKHVKMVNAGAAWDAFITGEAYRSQKFREATGIDGRRLWDEVEGKREQDADEVGMKLCALMFPGQEYRSN